MNKNRVIALNSVNEKKGPVIYWMSRDQRINSNWSLIYAQLIAEKKREDFAVIFNLVPDFLEAGYRQYDFMIKGLQKIEYKLEEKNIPFYILSGNPKKSIVQFLKSINAGALITDFDPLKIKRKWQSEVNKLINIPFYLVDAHNIVSCWQTSQKQEFGAYTIRPKIIRKLNEYLDNFPEIRFQKLKYLLFRKNNWKKIIDSLNINCDVNNATPFIPGEDIAHNQFKHFLLEKLDKYAENRNNPNIDASSNLSVYLHFGQISSQYVALEIIKNYEKTENTEAFLEELIVRKE
ncbi:MAG: deoxyribodipyrimidine photo-lyase, partial [Bacteroidales bacterium]|nr:deoxyribodipyrimidine photo-lyase [Bacteroidales bacterium]